MAYWIYKIIHIVGIVAMLSALAALAGHALNGGRKADNSARKLMAITHGVGLLLALLGGFGMMARLGIISGWPGWIWAKLGLWLVVGGLVALPYRKPELAKSLWFAIPLIAAAGAFLALQKPF